MNDRFGQQRAGGDVIGMAIRPVRQRDDARPVAADRTSTAGRDASGVVPICAIGPARFSRHAAPSTAARPLRPLRAARRRCRCCPSRRPSDRRARPRSPARRGARRCRPRPISMSSGCGPKTSRSRAMRSIVSLGPQRLHRIDRRRPPRRPEARHAPAATNAARPAREGERIGRRRVEQTASRARASAPARRRRRRQADRHRRQPLADHSAARAARRAERHPHADLRRALDTENATTPAMPGRRDDSASAANSVSEERRQPRRRERAVAERLERLDVAHRLLRIDAVHDRRG